MSLIKSISGIRGTIGGIAGENLTPFDIIKFTTAYAIWLQCDTTEKISVVVGRDGRISGLMVQSIVMNTLISLGIEVIDAGLSTTPTIELAVIWEKAKGGIIITASHNPKEWNALKLLNNKGEFISASEGAYILQQAEVTDTVFADINSLGKISEAKNYIEKHIAEILSYKWIDTNEIKNKKFKVVVDAINSTGALSVPPLLESLGADVVVLNADITGDFAHNPEPLPEHLMVLSEAVVSNNADLGISVDPDVDRLCFICEDGTMFGEEYTLVAVADYILSKQKGNTVSNLSSSRALKDIAEKHGCKYYASPVGEVNVVSKMKEVNAVIGGEGNGGIIVPDFHYGRDALIGIALFLSAYSKYNEPLSAFKRRFPAYHISKNKFVFNREDNIQEILEKIKTKYSHCQLNTEDGLRIEFSNAWVHLRTSNTEPIFRIYAEAQTHDEANKIAQKIIENLNEIIS